MRTIEYTGIGCTCVDLGLCCALGFFDGVHAGHRRLIEECIKTAKDNGLTPAVFTFRAEDMSLKENAPRLYTTEEKTDIFASLGIELVILCDFDAVRGLDPEEFVKDVLIGDLGCRIAMTGESFRFGRCALGNTDTLRLLMKEKGFDAITVPDLKIDGITVSSTEIRHALSEGRIRDAARLLGAPYFIRGMVRRGRGVGHTYGFPTVNTELRDNTILQTGVYKSQLELDGVAYTGLTNIGTCPTFESREMHAETMILDFSGNLYGKHIKINLVDFIRGEKKFDTPEDLRAQIECDIRGLEQDNGRSMD